MWKLEQRTDYPSPKTWHQIGEFASIGDAAQRIVEIEEFPDTAGAIFFQIYCWWPEDKSDADILNCLEYRGRKGLYHLQRTTH